MIGGLTAEPSDLSREAGLFCQIDRIEAFRVCVGTPIQTARSSQLAARLAQALGAVSVETDGYWQ
jgi:hypothetical protein